MNKQYCQKLDPVVPHIVHTLKAGKIYCYATINHAQVCESILMPKQIVYEHIYVHLLVISCLRSQKKIRKLKSKIPINTVPGITVTLTALSFTLAQQGIQAGDEFLNTAITQGKLLYSHDKFTLPATVPPAPALQKKKAEQYHQHLTMAEHFLNTAVHAIIEDKHAMAMWLFHQVVKETCAAIIQLCLSVTIKHASLNIQWESIQAVMPRLGTIFPRNTTEEEELFQDLCTAPQRIRQPHYHIAPHKVHVLSPRIQNLQQAIKDYFNDST